MRNLFISIATAAALVPFGAMAQQSPFWVAEPLGVYWEYFCGKDYPLVNPMTPNLQCQIDGQLIGKTNASGDILIDVNVLAEQWNNNKLPEVNLNALRGTDANAFLLYRSNIRLLNGAEAWSVKVNTYEFADLCEAYSGKYVGDGFYSLMKRLIFDQATQQDVTFYGPMCFVPLVMPDKTTQFVVLGGMLEDATWYVDERILEALPQ